MMPRLKVNDIDISLSLSQKAVAIVVQCYFKLQKKCLVPADAIVRCAGARPQ